MIDKLENDQEVVNTFKPGVEIVDGKYFMFIDG